MDVINYTQGLCAECHKVVAARIGRTEDKIVMEKDCPTHGLSEVVISSDPAWYARVTSLRPELKSPDRYQSNPRPDVRMIAVFAMLMNNAWFCRLFRLPVPVI